MFQHFDPVSDRTFAAKHLPLLRAEMKALGLDGFIVPHDDEYQNEYIPAYAERLMWASGFSGSAGAAIVFHDKAVIFTDGRYTLQVRQQVDEKFFDYADLVDTPPDVWLAENAAPGSRIGYDLMLHTKSGVERLEKAAAARGFTLVALSRNPVDAAWKDQPPRPLTPAKPHGLSLAGRASAEKRREVAAAIAKAGADAALVVSRDDAWPLRAALLVRHVDAEGRVAYYTPEGESLRKVHWPTTARRGLLMVKELEDAPRDDLVVLLDCDARAVAGPSGHACFDTLVRAAGSLVRAHVARGRRAALVLGTAGLPVVRAASLEVDWPLVLEALAAVELARRAVPRGLPVRLDVKGADPSWIQRFGF